MKNVQGLHQKFEFPTFLQKLFMTYITLTLKQS